MMKQNSISAFVPVDVKIPARSDFDTEYIDYEYKDVVKKTGDGEDDFVIVTKTIEKRTPIAEVVARDADSVGIRAIMERVALTGDQSLMPTPMPKDGVTNDYTNVPQDLLEVDQYTKRAAEAYAALPDELKKGRSFGKFCETITNDEYVMFLTSLQPKKDGDNNG